MQACKKVKKEGKQIAISIPPLRFTFSRASRMILSELDKEDRIEEIEMSLSQLFFGITCEDEPLKEMEFPTIPQWAV
mgnify:FL=1